MNVVQCELQRVDTRGRQIVWIPKRLARAGAVLRIDGHNWEVLWAGATTLAFEHLRKHYDARTNQLPSLQERKKIA